MAVHNDGAPPSVPLAEVYRLSGPLRTHATVKPQFQRRRQRLPIITGFALNAPGFCAFALTGNERRNEFYSVDCLPPHFRHTCLLNVDDQVLQQRDRRPLSPVLRRDRTGRRPRRVNGFLGRGAAVASVTPQHMENPLMWTGRALRQWPRFHRLSGLRRGSRLETTPARHEYAIFVFRRERLKRLSESSRFRLNLFRRWPGDYDRPSILCMSSFVWRYVSMSLKASLRHEDVLVVIRRSS